MIEQIIHYEDFQPSRCITQNLVFWGLWELKQFIFRNNPFLFIPCARCCQIPVNGTPIPDDEHCQPRQAPHLGPGPAQVSSSSYLLPPKVQDDAHGRVKINPRGERPKVFVLQAQKCKVKSRQMSLTSLKRQGINIPREFCTPLPMLTHLCAQSIVHRCGSELGRQLSSHAWYS